MTKLTLDPLCEKNLDYINEEDFAVRLVFEAIENKLRTTGIEEYLLNNYDKVRAQEKFCNIAIEFFEVLMNECTNENKELQVPKSHLLTFEKYDDWFCKKLVGLYKLNNDEEDYHLINTNADDNNLTDNMIDYIVDYLNRYNITKKIFQKYKNDEVMAKHKIALLIQKFICYIYHKKYNRRYDENNIEFFDESRPFTQFDIDKYANEFMTKEYEKI